MEREFIQWLTTRPTNKTGIPKETGLFRVLTGVGDDAASVDCSASNLVVTTDTISDTTHFDLSQHSLKAVGHKAMAVNLSDIAAMGARPVAATISYTVPVNFSLEQMKELFIGSADLADSFGVTIIGGDTNTWSGPATITITAFGVVDNRAGHAPWLMSGGSPDDAILVSGKFGGSIRQHHLTFKPRCELAIHLQNHFDIHAATDASDSLTLDLHALAEASDCGALIDLDSIPISNDAIAVAESSGRTPLDHALSDGEDFELILTCDLETAERILADDFAGPLVTRIGRLTEEHGLFDAATNQSIAVKGYDHGGDDNGIRGASE